MGEVLEFEAGGEPESPARREDIHEVLNYRSAMRHAEEIMQELPLCMRVIREAHRILLAGVRGEGKSPGEYRRVPNWIGPSGCTIDEATFVPVAAGKLPEAMGAWESYIHREAPDRLVQLAILHAEFEALHPFLDGNGRLGRMLVPLFLWRSGLIRAPRFYVSAYLEARRDAYYDGLLAVSRRRRLDGMVPFLPGSGSDPSGGQSGQGAGHHRPLRPDEAPRDGSDPFPARHPCAGLDFPVSDVHGQALRGWRGDPGAYGS